MKNLHQYFSWLVVGLGLLYLGSAMVPPRDRPKDFHVYELGELPVVSHGRVQPLDTSARISLMIISGRQSFDEENARGEKVRQPAIRWLKDIWGSEFDPRNPEKAHGPAIQHKVFRIEHEQLLSFLNLEPRPGFRYSLAEMAPRLSALMEQTELLAKKDPKKLDLYEAKLGELLQHLKLYVELAFWGAPHVIRRDKDNWVTLADALRESPVDEVEKSAAGGTYLELIRAARFGRADDFNEVLKDFGKFLQVETPHDLAVTRFETFFNHFAPFYQCAVLYVFVLILAVLSWLIWPDTFGRAAFWLGVLTLVVHTWALIARMYIQGRPPVTNLYSSAVFIGWGCVVLGLFMEFVYRNGIGSAVGAVTGALTLVIAHYLALSGDTLEMMQAVLDTNFWLATHVTCITLGYTATFFAGFLGIGYVLLGPINYLCETFGGSSRRQDPDADALASTPNIALPAENDGTWKTPSNPALTIAAFLVLGIVPGLVIWYFLKRNQKVPASAAVTLSRMIYGVVCFAMLLSFTGTVLGGIWADQSWGRFWGWDPKENGALLIVIWNALILHARWGGMAKARGIAVLAILGNIVTAWSWFGVNMLGVGLHSYGFMPSAVRWLLIFMASQLVFAAVGLLPQSLWQRPTGPGSDRDIPPEPRMVPPLGTKEAIMAGR